MNTRVSITTNGRIHIGHMAMILLNEQVAHNSGGKFHVRFDDGQPLWIKRIGMEQQRLFAEAIKQDMEWLGIRADSFVSEYDQKDSLADDVDWLSEGYPEMNGTIPHDYEQAIYKNISYTEPALYPLAPWLTAEKVVLDLRQEITHVIRGEEIMTEASLYAWFCWKLGMPAPVQWFIPRIRTTTGNDLGDVSKTKGNWKIRDLRSSKWTPEQVLTFLCRVCLINPNGIWSLENYKPHPYIIEPS